MKLKPIIAQGLLAGVLFAPITTWGLGLGKLTLQSALGEPLKAEIELVAAQKDELSSLTVRIADPATYRASNLDYQSSLSRINVVISQKPDGKSYLRLASSQIVNEPYLTLLIDANWAAGRLMREYTFLLDPPELTATQKTEESSAIQGKPITSTVKVKESIAKGSDLKKGDSKSAAVEPSPVVTKEKGGSTTYGPVKKGDTLSKIAKELKPEGISTEQMLLALFQANKEAFEAGNMNRLRVGPTLAVPGQEEIAAVNPAEAKKIVHVQTDDWQGYRGRVAQLAPKTEESASQSTTSGKITPQVEEKLPPKTSKDQLKLSKAQPSEGGGTQGKSKTEDLIAKENALKESQERIKQLESTVVKLQALLAIKSEKGANLQGQQQINSSSNLNSPPNSSIAPSSDRAGDSQSVSTSTQQTIPPSSSPANQIKDSVTVPPTNTEQATTQAITPAGEAKQENKSPDKQPDKPIERAPEAPKAKSAPRANPYWMDWVADNLPLVGGGVAVLLFAIGGFIFSRRHTKRSAFEESIISSSDAKTTNVFAHTGGGIVNTNTQSFLTDFSREGLGNIDAGEVDPIAEAEVYLAYGRDMQAEEILRDAMHKTPERYEVHLKLLEIYASQGKNTVFETLASELYTALNGQGPIWTKAAELGRQLDPANPLYAVPVGSGVASSEVTSKKSDLAPSPLSGFGKISVEAVKANVAGYDNTSDSLLNNSASELTLAKPSVSGGRVVNTEAELGRAPVNLDGVGAPGTAFPSSAELDVVQPKNKSPLSERSLSDFSVSVGASRTVTDLVTTESQSTKKQELASLDFELPVLDFSMDVQDKVDGPEKSDLTGSTSLGSISGQAFSKNVSDVVLEPTMETIELTEGLPEFDNQSMPPVESAAEEDATQPKWQEVATKLDLARAYQEMADWDGAREILQEVEREGSPVQQRDARELIAKLPN